MLMSKYYKELPSIATIKYPELFGNSQSVVLSWSDKLIRRPNCSQAKMSFIYIQIFTPHLLGDMTTELSYLDSCVIFRYFFSIQNIKVQKKSSFFILLQIFFFMFTTPKKLRFLFFSGQTSPHFCLFTKNGQKNPKFLNYLMATSIKKKKNQKIPDIFLDFFLDSFLYFFHFYYIKKSGFFWIFFFQKKKSEKKLGFFMQ